MEPILPPNLGAFRILRLLGSGATSVVYLGERAEQFSQRIAIKRLHPQASLLFGRQMLLHEEKVLTSLDHPDIVRLLDTGTDPDGAHFIVMEYVDGMPLDSFCAAHPLTTAQRINLLLRITRAADYAHRHLVVHGDLKPANILVSSTGQPRILDFGIAVFLDSARAQATPDEHAQTLLTPRFASAERLAGARPNVQSDVFSLGAIGQLLFADTSSRRTAAFRDLNAVFTRATESDPDLRYRSAHELAGDLEALLEDRPVSARPRSRMSRSLGWMRRNRTVAAMAALVLLLLLGSALGIILQTARANAERKIAQRRLDDLVRLTGVLQHELYDSVGPLAQGEPARASLRTALHQTLDALVAQQQTEEVGHDSGLAVEIAQQYQALALIEPAGSSIRAKTHEQALQELALVPPSDRQYASAQRLLQTLSQHAASTR